MATFGKELREMEGVCRVRIWWCRIIIWKGV